MMNETTTNLDENNINNISIFDSSFNINNIDETNKSLIDHFSIDNSIIDLMDNLNTSRKSVCNKIDLNALGEVNGVIMTHQNLRSINNKFAEIQTRLKDSYVDFHSFSETWLNSTTTDNAIHIDG